jgi:hypothetical protein
MNWYFLALNGRNGWNPVIPNFWKKDEYHINFWKKVGNPTPTFGKKSYLCDKI